MHFKTLWKFLLFGLIFGLISSGYADAEKTRPFQAGEKLQYKLSYRGILTSMIQADIADASIEFVPNQTTLDNHRGHQFVLSLSTENYTKAEIIHPVRYTYTTTLDNGLQKTLQVEEIDNGKSQSHDFLFLDWAHRKTLLYKKREKEQLSSGFLNMDSRYAWEADGEQDIPDFLRQYPPLENNLSYFIFDKQGDKITYPSVLDPLSLIYHLRTLPEQQIQDKTAVVIADDIYLYQIQQQGVETVKVSGREYQTLKYKINRSEKAEKFFYVWISRDSRKLPVKMSMDAPLGKLEIDLQRVIPGQSAKPAVSAL